MIPICCVGCKHAWNNLCHKKNYCWIYRVFRFFNKKYYVPKAESNKDIWMIDMTSMHPSTMKSFNFYKRNIPNSLRK